MNKIFSTLRVKSCVVSVAVSVLAAIPAFGWEETGPEVKGYKYGFGVYEPKEEKCTAVKENGLWGFINEKGKVVTKPVYEKVGTPVTYKGDYELGKGCCDKAMIPVWLKGKIGFVGQNGKKLIDPKFDWVGAMTEVRMDNGDYEAAFPAMIDGELLIVGINGKTRKSLGSGYSNVIPVKDGLVAFQNGQLKVVDGGRNGLEPQKRGDFYMFPSRGYNDPDSFIGSDGSSFNGGKILYDKSGNKLGRFLFNDNGLVLVDKNYNPLSSEVYISTRGLNAEHPSVVALIRSDGKNDALVLDDMKIYGPFDKTILDGRGELLVFAPSQESTTFGVMKLDGTVIIEPIYKSVNISDFGNFIRVNKDDKFGLMGPDGTVTAEPVYTSITYSEDGKYFVLEKDGKFGLMSTAGKEVLPVKYTSLTSTGNNLYKLSDDSGVGVYDAAKGQMVLPMGKYSTIGKKIFNGYAVWVSKGDKWGAATSDLSREIIAPTYGGNELFTGFGTSLDEKNYTFHVKKNGTVSVINFDGKTIIPLGRYTGIKGYDMGYIAVMKGKKVGLVDQKTGRQIIPPVHDRVAMTGKGHFLTTDNTANGELWTVYDKSGAVLKKQAFAGHQAYSASRFIIDWLGNLYATFDFRY